MNNTNYSCLLAKFNGSLDRCVTTNSEMMGIPLADERNMKFGIMKMTTLTQYAWPDCASERPLVRSLEAFFNIHAVSTAFHGKISGNHTWALLLSNKMVVFPQSKGRTLLTLTPYFVRDSNLKAFKQYVTQSLRATCSAYDNIYHLDDMVLFLDPFQAPYPGGTYFDEFLKPMVWYRICYLSRRGDGRIEQLTGQITEQKYLVTYTPTSNRSTKTYVSNLIRLPEPYELGDMPVENHKRTGTISKTKSLKNPNFILQDVIDSYRNHSSAANDHRDLGVVIETPITISYEYDLGDQFRRNAGAVDRKRRYFESDGRKFETYAINCTVPQTMLLVLRPYTNYLVYTPALRDIRNWTTLLYDYEQENLLLMDSVVFDHNIIGYHYRDVFFCLNNVQLMSSVISEPYAFVDKMFNLAKEVDLLKMADFTVFNKYELNRSLTLYRLKHQRVRSHLWCICKRERDMDDEIDDDDPDGVHGTSVLRRSIGSDLVRKWVNLVLETRRAKRFDHDIEITKMLYVMAKHQCCLDLRVCENERDPDSYHIENDEKVVFYLNQHLYDFVNRLRFDKGKDPESGEEQSSGGCVIS